MPVAIHIYIYIQLIGNIYCTEAIYIYIDICYTYAHTSKYIHIYIYIGEWWKWEIFRLEWESNHICCILGQCTNDYTTYPHLLVYAAPYMILLHSTSLAGIVSLLMHIITYIQVVISHTYTQGRFNTRTVHSLYRILVTVTMYWGWWKMEMGNILPRVGIEPTLVAFRVSVLTITPSSLPGVNILPTPTYYFLPKRSV